MDELKPEEMDKLAGGITPITNDIFTVPGEFQNLYNFGKMFAVSSVIPQNYQKKPMDCAVAIDMATRMGVSPIFVMQNLYVVKGKPSWSGQACISMLQNYKEYKKVRPVYFGEKNTEDWGCYIKVETVDGEIIKGPEVTMKMAKSEGWLSNPKWKNMPEQMLGYRAAAFFARLYIPNLLMGCCVEGEVEDIAPAKPKAHDPFAKEEMADGTDKQ